MFRKHCSSNPKQGQPQRSVNPRKHLSNQSPAEIIDEMETIFFDDLSTDIDPDLVDSYLAQLDELSPLAQPDDTSTKYSEFTQKHAIIMRDQFNDQVAAVPQKPKRHLKRIAVAAVAVFLLTTFASVTYAQNPSSPFVHWIDEVFSFGVIDPDNFHSVQEALSFYGYTDTHMPTWLPPHYAITNVSVNETEISTSFVGHYVNAENAEDVLTLMVKRYPTGSNTFYEKDATITDTYVSGSRTYYITQNYDSSSIMWYVDNFEYYISGDLSEEEISSIINSIE